MLRAACYKNTVASKQSAVNAQRSLSNATRTVAHSKKCKNMQTSARFTQKQLTAQMQQAIALYMQANAVKVYKQKQLRFTRSLQCATRHIGKNCATRCNARV
jgi:hypothetical protein